MSAYEAKRQARIERYQQRAEKAQQHSQDAYDASNRAVEHIPLGQPILVGHHSEKRHRRAIARAQSAMDRSVAEQRKAAYWLQRAEATTRNTAISSDDP